MIISNKYEVVGQIGQGTMGVVYKVRHVALETILALKVLPHHLMGSADLMKRFYREARVMARFNHPHIVRVIDIHKDDDLQFHYIVMEFIQGKTLREHLADRGRLTAKDIIVIAQQIGQALEFAHRHNPPVIHRDIKPSNIMIEDQSKRVVVTDFGIAKELDETEMTKAGTMLGTLRYCPPEQMRHEQLDGNADIYALGMIMHEASVGRHLFSDLDEHEVVGKVLDQKELDISFLPGTPSEFKSIVLKAVAKSRDKRYRQMSELLSDLAACLTALSGPTSVVVPIASGKSIIEQRDDCTELTDEVIILEQEQARRSALHAEAQMRERQEDAADKSASKYASARYQQAQEREEQGREHFRASRFVAATEAYQAAATSFSQAAEEAFCAAMLDQAGQAKQEMTAAKVEADRYSAVDRAHTVYRQGMALQAQADQLWEHRSYREAWPIYGEARDVFEQAHELAYRSLIEEDAKESRLACLTARESAVKVGSEQFAAQMFSEALRIERCGNLALERAEFTEARESFRVALTQFEESSKRAREERTRREAERLKDRVQNMQARGDPLRAWVQAAWAEADRRAEEATTLLERGDYAAASGEFNDALKLYETARTTAEHEARQHQQATEARRQAEIAKKDATLGKEAFPALRDAARYIERGEAAFGDQQWQDARNAFEEVRRIYETISLEGATQAKQAMHDAKRRAEESDARARCEVEFEHALATETEAQSQWDRKAFRAAEERFALACAEFEKTVQLVAQARARNEAEAERAKAVVARDKARAAQAESLANNVFGRAHASEERADAEFGRAKFGSALSLYQAAVADYEEARRQAAEEWGKREAEAEKARMRIAKMRERVRAYPTGSEARQWARSSWGRADRRVAEAQAALERGDYGQAAALFEAAIHEFEIAESAAADERLQQRAARAQREAGAAREEADAAESQRYSMEVYKKSQDEMIGGERALSGQHWEEAVARFESAREFYVQCRDAARIAKHKLAADAARVTAEAAQGEASECGSRELFPERFQRAAELLDAAEEALRGRVWTSAAERFGQAAAIFQDLTRTATLHRQRDDAEKVRARATALASRLAAVRSWKKRRALRLLERGGRFYAQQRYADARALYGEACKHLEVLRDAVRPGSKASRSPSAVKLGLIAVLSVAIIAGMIRYFFPTPRPSQVVQKAAPAPIPAAEPPLNAHPKFIAVNPDSEDPLKVAEGEALEFSIAAESPNREELSYAWFLDGVNQADGNAWRYEPDFDAARQGSKKIKATVTDPAGRTIAKVWDIEVVNVNRPPSLDQSEPKSDTMELQANQGLAFSVRASDPDADDALHYVWSLDGTQIAEGERWQYKAADQEGRHKIEVTIADPASATVKRTWDVIVKPPPKLSIAAVEPEGRSAATFALSEGKAQTFKVRAEGAPEASLGYAWFLNGKEQARTAQWTYRPDFSQAATVPKEVKVVVSGTGERRAEWIWRVRVRDVNRPPEIRSATPREARFILKADNMPSFGVDAQDQDSGERLVYRWMLDGKEVSRSNTWQPSSLLAEGEHRLQVTVSDAAGLQAQHIWRVTVQEPQPSPPTIIPLSPRDQEIATDLREPLEFSVTARSAGQRSPTLRYQWKLDNDAGALVDNGRYWLTKADPGRHQLAVVAIGAKGLTSDPYIWDIDVRPVAISLSENEVRDWLESYRQAWEQRDIDRLMRLGEISSPRADKLRRVLAGYGDFRVRLENVRIRLAGNQATVTLSRVDVIDGEMLRQPDPKEFVLQKQGDGRITRRR